MYFIRLGNAICLFKFKAMKWLVVALFCLLLACSQNEKWKAVSTPKNWHQVRVGDVFLLSLPPGLTSDNTRAFDSLFGQFSDDRALLYYDFGQFSDPLTSYREKATYREESVSIDKHRARIITVIDADGDADFPHVAAIHFNRLQDGNRLTIHLRCASEEICQEYSKIFYSVQLL